jgi:hypothetical protein
MSSVFISYSHDSADTTHAERDAGLAASLLEGGFEVTCTEIEEMRRKGFRGKAARRALVGSSCTAARKPSRVPSVILFLIHSASVTSEKGEIVRFLRSEAVHFKNR